MPRRALPVPPRASSSAQAAPADADVAAALDTLRRAAADSTAPPASVFQALRTLEAAKLPTEEWPATLGGTASPGRRWRLVFTSGTKEVQKAMKGVGQGSGKYFPLTAVQRWDAATGQIENGVFLGFLGSLTFSGPYAFKGKKLAFDFDSLKVKIGPAKLEFKLKDKITEYAAGPKDPFFIFFYVGDDFVAARGRGGGVAFWARTAPAWELENGVA